MTDTKTQSLRYLDSARLRLVAATPELVGQDLQGQSELASVIEAEVPPNWPPDLYDRPAMQYAARQLADPGQTGWSFWYMIDRLSEPPVVIGICGFKGRPDAQGRVEIGYSVLSQFRNQGFASEATARLVSWAFGHGRVREVSAETLPHLVPSIRVLEKNGFALRGKGSERGVVRYVICRDQLN